MTEKSIQEMAVCLAPWFWAANNNAYWLSAISEEKKPGKYESWMTFCWYAVGAFNFTTCDLTPRNKWANPNAPGHDTPRCFASPKARQPSSYDNNTTLKRIISWPQKHINWMICLLASVGCWSLFILPVVSVAASSMMSNPSLGGRKSETVLRNL